VGLTCWRIRVVLALTRRLARWPPTGNGRASWHLLAEGICLVEVDPPRSHIRSRKGKDGVIDAEAALRQFLASGAAPGRKTTAGVVESIGFARLWLTLGEESLRPPGRWRGGSRTLSGRVCGGGPVGVGGGSCVRSR